MNKLNLLILLCLLTFGVLSANAQSGSAGLKVFVKCGGVGNDGCRAKKVKVTLRPIEVWSKSTETVEMNSDSDGYYSAEVSFGEYELMIVANGFETYRTTVYIPSSNFLEWAVRLHEIKKKSVDRESKT